MSSNVDWSAVSAALSGKQPAKRPKQSKKPAKDKQYQKQALRHSYRALQPKARQSRKFTPAKAYQAKVNGDTATLYVYGDITNLPISGSSDVSLASFQAELDELPDTVKKIVVRINSYGGDVFDGIAIYNALRNSGLQVETVVDGVAASIASVIFMAGSTRTMAANSMLFIHNAWKMTVGNAADHRKAADDLDAITEASVTAYKECAAISEDELRRLMDEETWLTADQAIDAGLANAKQ